MEEDVEDESPDQDEAAAQPQPQNVINVPPPPPLPPIVTQAQSLAEPRPLHHVGVSASRRNRESTARARQALRNWQTSLLPQGGIKKPANSPPRQ